MPERVRAPGRGGVPTDGVFRDLTPAASKAILKQLAIRRLRKRDLVYRHGDGTHLIYLMLEGGARLARTTAEGREVILGLVLPGDVFGDEALSDGKARTATAECVNDALVGSIAAEAFRDILLTHPEISMNLARRWRERLDDIETRVEDLQCRLVRQRILRSLQRIAATFGRPSEDGIALTLSLTHYDIATFAGCTRETASSEIARLVRAGYVSRTRAGAFVLHATDD